MAAEKATDTDRFEVMQAAIESQGAVIAQLMKRLQTAEDRIKALSEQSSFSVMGIKVEEPRTKRNDKHLTPDGWDTSERANA